MGYHPASLPPRTPPWQALAAALALALALPAHGAAPAERDWFVHTYVAQFTHHTFLDTLRLQTDLDASWLAAVGVGRAFSAPAPHTRLEWELQAAKHWGLQGHPEVNALTTVRWHTFHWDRIIRNTVAFGLGASYAFDIPAVEQAQGKGARALIYMMFEITAAPPPATDWSVFLRIHHRSGSFGFVSEADGSNFIGIGLRHRF